MKNLIAISLLLAIIGCGGSASQTQNTQAMPVTFYGDSLTAFWHLDQSFPGKPYANDGTFGLTAVTLAANFQSSVPATHPGAVLILGGTNDVLQGDNSAHIFSALTGMYDQAAADSIPLVICTIPPMTGGAAFHNAVIVDVNSQLRSYAAAKNIPLADYYAALVDSSTGELQAVFSLDNVHLTSAGYASITPVANRAIAAIR